MFAHTFSTMVAIRQCALILIVFFSKRRNRKSAMILNSSNVPRCIRLRGNISNRTYGTHKNVPGIRRIFTYFYQQYLVLFTLVPRNSVFPHQTPDNTQQELIALLLVLLVLLLLCTVLARLPCCFTNIIGSPTVGKRFARTQIKDAYTRYVWWVRYAQITTREPTTRRPVGLQFATRETSALFDFWFGNRTSQPQSKHEQHLPWYVLHRYEYSGGRGTL